MRFGLALIGGEPRLTRKLEFPFSPIEWAMKRYECTIDISARQDVLAGLGQFSILRVVSIQPNRRRRMFHAKQFRHSAKLGLVPVVKIEYAALGLEIDVDIEG